MSQLGENASAHMTTTPTEVRQMRFPAAVKSPTAARKHVQFDTSDAPDVSKRTSLSASGH